MVGIVAVWRCKCGMRVKVLAEAENNQTSSTQVASCPECGNQQVIRAEKIISITEEIDVAYPATA
jgi:predicted RNA-binding Zn-ribbon protein involved in translation (DUF1610 family)